MKLLKKLFTPKELRLVLGLLDEAEHKFNYPAFKIVRDDVEKLLAEVADDIAGLIRNGDMTPRQCLYSSIATISENHVSSGQYHLHRGVLNPMGMGDDLLKIFDGASDELKIMGFVDEKETKERKDDVREQIKHVG